MRKMQGKSLGEDGICTVVEHIIIKNMWEYYILKTDLDEADDSYRTALVVGDYTEIGGVPGWEWVTDEEAHAFLNVTPNQ